MAKYVYVTGDTNDGDYTSTLNKIEAIEDYQGRDVTEEELEKLLEKVAGLVKTNKGYHTWCIHEYAKPKEDPTIVYKGKITPEEVELFNECFVPSGIHSIEAIQILEVSDIKTLL